MQTPTTKNIVDIHLSQYIHVGFKAALDRILADINGLPIAKSSNSGFWLILGSAQNLPNHSIFVIVIYHGSQKPKMFSDFLKPHVAELKDLIANYTFQNRKIKVTYICDAPARAVLPGTKCHNAYFGCNKCSQEGSYIKGRMTFPENCGNLRTNESFRNRTDENYHKYDSPIEELPVDMVNAFPLDYLHVVCLGVMKRLLRMWISGDTLSLMPSTVISEISSKLLRISSTQPSCF